MKTEDQIKSQCQSIYIDLQKRAVRIQDLSAKIADYYSHRSMFKQEVIWTMKEDLEIAIQRQQKQYQIYIVLKWCLGDVSDFDDDLIVTL